MSRRPDTAAIKKSKGRTKPSDQIAVLYPDHASRPDSEAIEPPKWMSAQGKRIFRQKVERYRHRGQKIEGFEESLAAYCALEDEMIALRRKRVPVPVSMINTHRQWANEFYDTPASQRIGSNSIDKGENRFARNGRRG